MKPNESGLDRLIRIAFGILLFVLYFTGVATGTVGIVFLVLGALALGAKGAVGSSYNFAAPIYQRLIAAFESGDLEAAQKEQFRSAQVIDLLASYGYMAAAKATMGFLGVEVGAPRLPNISLGAKEIQRLESQLHELGFFGWIA